MAAKTNKTAPPNVAASVAAVVNAVVTPSGMAAEAVLKMEGATTTEEAKAALIAVVILTFFMVSPFGLSLSFACRPTGGGLTHWGQFGSPDSFFQVVLNGLALKLADKAVGQRTG